MGLPSRGRSRPTWSFVDPPQGEKKTTPPGEASPTSPAAVPGARGPPELRPADVAVALGAPLLARFTRECEGLPPPSEHDRATAIAPTTMATAMSALVVPLRTMVS